MSHALISLLLFAQVGQDALFFFFFFLSAPAPPFFLLPFTSHSLSRSPSLPLSRSPPSVFVPRGPVVQLKLSVTQRNQIGFHLKPVTSRVHGAIALPLSTRKSIDFTRDTVIIIGFESSLSLEEGFLLRQLQSTLLISY